MITLLSRLPITTLLVSIALITMGCGGSSPQAETTPNNDEHLIEEPATHAAPTETEPPAPAPITDVTRAQLDGIIEKGPAYVLSMVQTDSEKQNGKFVGFRIVSFRTEAPSILGILPEDIVQTVNQQPIESPAQFFAVFEKLKTAKQLEFAILRNGEEITLTTPIQ